VVMILAITVIAFVAGWAIGWLVFRSGLGSKPPASASKSGVLAMCLSGLALLALGSPLVILKITETNRAKRASQTSTGAPEPAGGSEDSPTADGRPNGSVRMNGEVKF